MIAPSLIQTDENGDLVFTGGSWEEHVEAWREIQGSVTEHFFALGAIGDSLARNYGDSDIERFGRELGISRNRIYVLVRVYRGWKGKQKSPMLSFTHHEVALDAPDPVEALARAEDESWSTRQMMRWIKDGGQEESPPRRKPEPMPSIVIPQRGRELDAWVSRVRSRSCLVGVGCSGGVEFAHLEAIPSTNFEGFLGRRDGLGMWPGIPLCAGHHRNDKQSVHAIGEQQFVELYLGGYKRAFGWILRELIGFILEAAAASREADLT